MKRVGLVCHFPPPPGGMPLQAVAFEAALQDAGMQVVRIVTNLDGTRLWRLVGRIRVLRSMTRTAVFLWRFLRRLPEVDVLHVMSASGLSFVLFAAPVILLGRATGKWVVLHYHSGAADVFFSRAPRLLRWIVDRAHAVIVPSGYLRDVFARYGISAGIVPNICDLERFPYRPREVRPAFLVNRHLEPVYDVETVIRAFGRILAKRPDATLVIAGGGSETSRLRRLVDDLGLAPAVSFLGYVDNARVPALFGDAAIMLNASLSDNVPIAILEAFASGVPVVSSNAGGIAYLAEDGVSGLLCRPRDPGALANLALGLLNDPGLARQLAENGRAVALEHTAAAATRRLIAHYPTACFTHADECRHAEGA